MRPISMTLTMRHVFWILGTALSFAGTFSSRRSNALLKVSPSQADRADENPAQPKLFGDL
jgi:hypothetical protein